MNRPNSPLREQELMSRLRAGNRPAFSGLYDRYAPALLGIITRIIDNEAEAVQILEKTFIEVRSKADQYQAAKQPLFVWLLNIARRIALDALKTRKTPQTPPFQFTALGLATTSALPVNHTSSSANVPVNSPLNELLNAVIFKNCTPEEAAASLGIPVELARQQLRLAMQQVRVP